MFALYKAHRVPERSWQMTDAREQTSDFPRAVSGAIQKAATPVRRDGFLLFAVNDRG